MTWPSIVILIVIGVLVALAIVRGFFSKKNKKGCGGSCSGCSAKQCPTRDFDNENSEEESKK